MSDTYRDCSLAFCAAGGKGVLVSQPATEKDEKKCACHLENGALSFTLLTGGAVRLKAGLKVDPAEWAVSVALASVIEVPGCYISVGFFRTRTVESMIKEFRLGSLNNFTQNITTNNQSSIS
jgi:hypothetical protein